MLTASADISASTLSALHSLFDSLVQVEQLCSDNEANLALLGKPELCVTFTKVLVWSLVQFSKVVFLDADMLVLESIDSLMDRPEFSACADAGWPDCFNTGLFVCVPNSETLALIMRHASAKGSFDGGDQGLLNEYFSNWSTLAPVHRIPFIYNVIFSLHYSYRPAFRRFSENVKAVHFIGPYKPWMGCDNASAGANAWAGELGQYVQLWCKFYREAGVQFVDCPGPLQFAAGVGDKGCEVFERDFQDYKVQWSSKVDELMKVGGGGGAGIEGVGLRKMPFVRGKRSSGSRKCYFWQHSYSN